MQKPVLQTAEILLPEKQEMEKWPVIACDQYTSQPEYWEKVKEIVGNNPSTYKIILPEVFLEKENTKEKINEIHEKMREYEKNILTRKVQGYIYVERVLNSGKIRQGLIGVIDLEEYSYEKGATCRVLPSENTIVDRIPPRLEVRRNAMLESPHILMLADDWDNKIIEPLADKKEKFELLYDQELMLNGGRISGWAVTDINVIKEIENALKLLDNDEKFKEKYKTEHACFSLIAGDGNHSLATAKAYWEEIKLNLSEKEQQNHSARFCLVEIENVQSDAIEIEPIHRVIFRAKEDDFFKQLNDFIEENNNVNNNIKYKFKCIGKKQEIDAIIKNNRYPIETAVVDDFLQKYQNKNPQIIIDYIHGNKEVKEIVEKEGAIGVLLPPMKKSDLFKGVANGDVLPKKTFSMGHAYEKRYYIECRKINKK